MTAPVFTGCTKCLDTGWAYVPHSDESRELCDCEAGNRVLGAPNKPVDWYEQFCEENTEKIRFLDDLHRAQDALFLMRALVIVLSAAVSVLFLRDIFS